MHLRDINIHLMPYSLTTVVLASRLFSKLENSCELSQILTRVLAFSRIDFCVLRPQIVKNTKKKTLTYS